MGVANGGSVEANGWISLHCWVDVDKNFLSCCQLWLGYLDVAWRQGILEMDVFTFAGGFWFVMNPVTSYTTFQQGNRRAALFAIRPVIPPMDAC